MAMVGVMSRQERQLVLELPLIYGVFGCFWWGIYMGSDAWGSVPQWITALVAALALIVATTGVLVQWFVARKRAAIDFFLKTEADVHMIAAYDKFWAGIRQMRTMEVNTFCTSD